MTDKHMQELELTQRLFEALGYESVSLAAGDRPDVRATIRGRVIGIEVTEFHSDESSNGSPARADEEKMARKADSQPDSYTKSFNINPIPGLRTRIDAKREKAKDYPNQNLEELWLLIVAQVPKPGATVATFIAPPFLGEDSLNDNFPDMFPFDRAYVYLALTRQVYAWSPDAGWELVAHKEPFPKTVIQGQYHPSYSSLFVVPVVVGALVLIALVANRPHDEFISDCATIVILAGAICWAELTRRPPLYIKVGATALLLALVFPPFQPGSLFEALHGFREGYYFILYAPAGGKLELSRYLFNCIGAPILMGWFVRKIAA